MLITTPNGPVAVRPALESDAPAFRELRLEALRNHPEAFCSDYEANLAKPLNEWSERLRFPRREHGEMIFFATHAEALIGMSGIYPGDSPKNRHSAMIWGVYVQPAWRGLQIAESLITACIECARTRGAKLVKLGVATHNTAAIRCYARLGFTVYGVEPQAIAYGQSCHDELLMFRSI